MSIAEMVLAGSVGDTVPGPVSDAVVKHSPRDPVAQRILALLEACAAQRQPSSITALAEATGLAKSTVHRLCWKLEGLGMLDHIEGGFLIGTKLFALAGANPVIGDLRVAAMPYLVELQKITGASQLAVLNGSMALIVDGLYTKNLRAATLVGSSMPLYCTAAGKALLARMGVGDREQYLSRGMMPAVTPRTTVNPAMLRRQIERIREAGYAVSNEEFQMGIVGIAAAFQLRENTFAAIGCVSTSTDRAIDRAAAGVRSAAIQLDRYFAQG